MPAQSLTTLAAGQKIIDAPAIVALASELRGRILDGLGLGRRVDVQLGRLAQAVAWTGVALGTGLGAVAFLTRPATLEGIGASCDAQASSAALDTSMGQ